MQQSVAIAAEALQPLEIKPVASTEPISASPSTAEAEFPGIGPLKAPRPRSLRRMSRIGGDSTSSRNSLNSIYLSDDPRPPTRLSIRSLDLAPKDPLQSPLQESWGDSKELGSPSSEIVSFSMPPHVRPSSNELQFALDSITTDAKKDSVNGNSPVITDDDSYSFSETCSSAALSRSDRWQSTEALRRRATEQFAEEFISQGMAKFWPIFQRYMDVYLRTHGAQSGGSPTSGAQLSQASSSGLRRSRATKKRPAHSDPPGGDGDDDGDDDRSDPPQRQTDSGPIKRFACPYRKRNPDKYNWYCHQGCTGWWPDTHRVK